MQCVMPFIHMNIKPNETATACWRCVEGLGNYTENNLEDIWYGDQWQEFRRQHLAGEKPKACNSCWEMEEAGIKSTRLTCLEDYADQVEALKDVEDLINPPFPRDMEFRFGNLCNMKCRHCSPKFSSQWVTQMKKDPKFYKDAKDVSGTGLNFSISQLPEDTMQQLKSFAPNLNMIRITGGEPLMHPMHHEMLEVLKPYAQNITLEYSTNLHYLNSVLEHWPLYKRVICRVSVDSDPSTYEYLREGGNLDKLVGNWNTVKTQMASNIESKQLDLHATCTVNVLNVVKIDKVLEFWTKLGSRLHVSFVQYPKVMDICNLPNNLKDLIRERCHIGLEYTKQHALETSSNRLLHHQTQSIEKIIKWLDKPVNAEFDHTFVKWMRAQDKVNDKCLFDYYTEFDYLKDLYYA